MEEKLQKLYKECILELKSININVEENDIGKIDINLAKRKCKRYGCCKQEEPDKSSKEIKKVGRKKIVKYNIFKIHHIEISKWVMELDEKIIKNTIIHEIIHCMPYCNDHGKQFKEYKNIINIKLGYNITRVGNREKDYKKSNVEFKDDTRYRYKIICTKCGQTFLRQRIKRNFKNKYRCGICGGMFREELLN